jgi:hypothetical protein
MAYVVPNVFVNATALDATLVQANNDTLKKYVDGGAVAGDVSTATWVRAPHIMRGTYIPLQNLHEFATGVVRGSTYEENDINVSADRFRTPYPAFNSSNGNTVVEFTNEEASWDQRIGWQMFPRHMPVDTTPTTTVGQLTQTTIGADYKAHTCQENDAGNYRNTVATFEQGIPGMYRVRSLQNWEYVNNTGSALGQNIVKQWFIGTNNIVNDFADFGYQLEVYYK